MLWKKETHAKIRSGRTQLTGMVVYSEANSCNFRSVSNKLNNLGRLNSTCVS